MSSTAKPKIKTELQLDNAPINTLPVKSNGSGVTETTPDTITAMLNAAINNNVPVETLEKIVALHERVSNRMAESEFIHALAEFQHQCPPIKKTSSAKIVTKSGSSYSYKYAELDEIARAISPLLYKQGLSYTWDSKTEADKIVCICHLRHVAGHTVMATFTAPVDTGSSMSGAQKHAAALTYARRQALIQVLGLTTCDPDTDAGLGEKITESQACDLEAMAEEAKANKPDFLKFMNVKSFGDIPVSQHQRALTALDDKRRQSQ